MSRLAILLALVLAIVAVAQALKLQCDIPVAQMPSFDATKFADGRRWYLVYDDPSTDRAYSCISATASYNKPSSNVHQHPRHRLSASPAGSIDLMSTINVRNGNVYNATTNWQCNKADDNGNPASFWGNIPLNVTLDIIDTDYDTFAAVSACIEADEDILVQRPLILSRTPALPKDIDDIKGTLTSQGFNTNPEVFAPIDVAGCK